MRLAVLADVHGNLPALEAALERLEALRPDRILHLGDVVNGAPDSAACWRLLATRGVLGVRGNHERYVLESAADRPERAPTEWGPSRWAAAQLTGDELAALAALPERLELPGGLELVHASPRHDRDHLFPDPDPAELREKFASARAPTVLRGHNHVGFEARLPGLHVIALGSVGLPLEGDARARCALVEGDDAGGWRVTRLALRYDVARALRRFDETGYLEAAGPMARLFRAEVATGRSHVVPFARAVARWRAAEPGLSLEAGLERFLAEAGAPPPGRRS